MKKVITFLIKFFISAVVLFFVIGKLSGFVKSSPKNIERNKEELVSVEKGDLTTKISATGLVRPKTKVNIIPLKRGRINEILTEEGDRVKKGQILAWMSSEERIALVDTALAGLEETKKSQDEKRIKQAERELEIAQNTYAQIPIVAPINGIVILRGAEPGQTVSLDDSIFILADVLVVVARVDEVDIGKVKKEQPVNVIVDAFPDKTFQGKVTKIAFESKIVDNITYYEITTDLVLATGELKSGMGANVEIITFQKEEAMLIPAYLIKEGKNQSYVWIKKGPDDYKQRFIKIGFTDGKNVEVLSGLSAGEKIVIKQDELTEDASEKQYKFGVSHIRDYFRKNAPSWFKSSDQKIKKMK
ncbi:efflux RND transporter periplasmic adaptor subunit [Candidatus Omnitrophota bacterium]